MSTVHDECRWRFDPDGLFPCIYIAGGGITPRSEDCKDWCPLLNRRIEEDDDGDA